MRKSILLSLALATVLFTACGEDAKKATSDATASITETVKETASSVVDTTKEKVAEVKDIVVEKTKEASDVVKETTSNAVEATTEVVKEAVVDNAAGKAAYAKCAGCHGVDGKTKALGKSAIVAGQAVETLVKSMNEYKAGTRNVAGMGMLMKGQVASMSDDDIKAVSEYMSGL